MKKIKRFNDMINESLPPYDPNMGYYDMSNGNMDKLRESLDENDIKYDYDIERNYLIIEVNVHNEISTTEIAKMIIKSNGDYVTFNNTIIDDYIKNPNDVVLIRLKRYKSSAPDGAYF